MLKKYKTYTIEELAKKIDELINEIIYTNITPGVQVSELIENVYEDCYGDFLIQKNNNNISIIFTFTETYEDDEKVSVKMRYTYDCNKYLIRIEQMIGERKFKIQWDKKIILDRMNDELIAMKIVLEKSLSKKAPSGNRYLSSRESFSNSIALPNGRLRLLPCRQ
jgi:hypothetical protein